MIITSKANPLIKKMRALAEKKFREEYGEYIVEGIKPVKECLSAGFAVTAIVCREGLSEEFPQATAVSDAVFEYISTEKSPQGVIASVKIPDSSLKKPRGNALLLDRVRDPGNVGTIMRTANAAGYEDLYLIDCADAYSPKAVRASMGGIFYVSVHVGDQAAVLESLSGTPLVCADMDGEDIFSFRAPASFCLCVGNEGGGLSQTVKDAATHTVKIPMRSTCESLNVGISAAIAMYALKNNRIGDKK